MPEETTRPPAGPDATAAPPAATDASPAPIAPLDIEAVLFEAWYEIQTKWPYLPVALLPVAVIAVVLGQFFGEQGPFEPFAPAPVMGLLLSATLALFALICHRIVLLGPD